VFRREERCCLARGTVCHVVKLAASLACLKRKDSLELTTAINLSGETQSMSADAGIVTTLILFRC
jgi:hypothetical protein